MGGLNVPNTSITYEVKTAEEGFLYNRRTAVCQMLSVTQNDRRCRI
jgi:hypothetical protein